MSGDAVAEVLDIEGALEAGGEETAERRYEGGKTRKNQEMELVRRVGNRGTTSKLAMEDQSARAM